MFVYCLLRLLLRYEQLTKVSQTYQCCSIDLFCYPMYWCNQLKCSLILLCSCVSTGLLFTEIQRNCHLYRLCGSPVVVLTSGLHYCNKIFDDQICLVVLISQAIYTGYHYNRVVEVILIVSCNCIIISNAIQI